MYNYRPTNNTDTHFSYNGDYSGKIQISDGTERVYVAMGEILAFVAEYARTVSISRIEKMTSEEILQRLTQ